MWRWTDSMKSLLYSRICTCPSFSFVRPATTPRMCITYLRRQRRASEPTSTELRMPHYYYKTFAIFLSMYILPMSGKISVSYELERLLDRIRKTIQDAISRFKVWTSGAIFTGRSSGCNLLCFGNAFSLEAATILVTPVRTNHYRRALTAFLPPSSPSLPLRSTPLSCRETRRLRAIHVRPRETA